MCQYPEHRQVTTEGPGVLVTWTTMRYTYGGTGSSEKTVLTDATPHTDSFADAAIDSNYTVYLGSTDEEYPVHIIETTKKQAMTTSSSESPSTQARTSPHHRWTTASRREFSTTVKIRITSSK